MVLPEDEHLPGNAQVPGQFLGYGLQYTRMVSLLLESNDSATVSLEVFEDVGVQEGEETLASQTKSSTAGENPVSNRAAPFWKSFSNWLKALESGQLSVNDTYFELYVFGDFQGEICDLFSKAKDEAQALAAISEARRVLALSGESIPSRIESVLNYNPKTLTSLIVRFRYRHGSGTSSADLKEQLSKALIPQELIDKVLIHACGWVKMNVDQLIEKGQPAVIKVADFRAEITAFIQSLAFSACLADLAGHALPEDLEGHRSRRYVRQLDLIAVADERKLSAISAYLRSSVNRTEWGRLGSVHQNSLDDFEHSLTNYWKNAREQCEIALASKEPKDRGRYLLAECMKCKPPLQGKIVPHDFVEGCYHALSDELLLGWHPEFEKLTSTWK